MNEVEERLGEDAEEDRGGPGEDGNEDDLGLGAPDGLGGLFLVVELG